MPPSCSTEAARWMCRGCGCRGSIGWMGARLDTHPMLCWRAHHGKNSAKNNDPRSTRRRVPNGKPASVGEPPGSACTAQNVRANRTFGAERLVFVAPASLQVTHLVQAAFLFRGGFAGHPLPLLDELADFLAALAPDLLVEGRAILVADGLTALSPPELTTLAADLLVELDAPLVANAFAALAAGFGDRHAAFSVAAGLDHLVFPSRSHSCAGSGTTSPPGAGVLSSEDLALSLAAFLPSSISVRTRCPPFLPISS